jgi:uncharacterized protein (TIGR02118 family)
VQSDNNKERRSLMIRVSVMYPNEGNKFDMNYYLNKHVPLAQKLLSPYGLVRIEVDKGIGTAKPGDPAPFVAIGYMVFNTIEGMQKGIQAHDPELAADVFNFTDIRPQFLISEIMK